MAKPKRWEGPFKFDNGGDGTCVKCDAKWQYRIVFGGFPVAVCREHALEGLVSKDGGRTKARALEEIAEIDAERWRSMNTHVLSWVPVRDKLPPVMEKVMAFDPHWPIIQSARHDGEAWNCEGVDFLEPTHWMPLPKLPRDIK